MLTPDLELEVVDLSARRHVVLGRNSNFPPHLFQACYIFDELSKNEMERQKKLARTMGSILDDADPVDVSAQVWVACGSSCGQVWRACPLGVV